MNPGCASGRESRVLQQVFLVSLSPARALGFVLLTPATMSTKMPNFKPIFMRLEAVLWGRAVARYCWNRVGFSMVAGVIGRTYVRDL